MKRRYWRAAWTFLPYLRRYKALSAASVGFLLLGTVVTLAEPWPFALLVDYVLEHKAPPQVVTAIFGRDPLFLIGVAVSGVLLVAFLVNGVAVLNEWVNTKIDQSVSLDFRSDLFAHCQELTDFFTDDAAPGDFMYRINYEARAVGAMSVAFPPIAQSILTVIGMFVIAVALDPVLALIALVVVPFIYFSSGYYAKRIEPRLVTVRGLEGISLTMVNQAMTMVHVITSFNRQRYEYDRFRRQGEMARDARVGLTVRQTVFSLGVALITATGAAAVLGVGAYHVLTGRTTVGGLIVLMAYIHSMYKPLEALAHTVSSLQVNLVSIIFSRQLLERQPEIQDRPGALTLGQVVGHIRFEHVAYDYPGRAGTLRDISFEAKPGEVIAIVGMTGAGKSTLIQMLPRFLDPASGRILLDGHDIRDLTLESLRSHVALVRQEPLLFPRTVAENIAYARSDATMTEVIAAARAANAHDFIEALPDGYDTVLGERGGRISGGERQRIALARAFLKDAPILILDEPTSSVDSKTESIILEALDRLTAGRTTFIVAHRLSTIRAASRVLVIDHGEIAEQGPPAELRRSGGLFAMLTRLQAVDTSTDGLKVAVSPPLVAAETNGNGHGNRNGNREHTSDPLDDLPLMRRNSLVQLLDKARRSRGVFTGAIRVEYHGKVGRVFVRDGRRHHADGDLGSGDDFLVQALSWPEEEFSLTLEPRVAAPDDGNLKLGTPELLRAAALLQASGRAPAATSAPMTTGGGVAVAEAPPMTISALPPAPAHGSPVGRSGARARRSAPVIVLLGSMSPMPVGGVIWQTLQYLVGFRRLGYDVYYVEAHGRTPHMLMSNPEQDPNRVATEFIGKLMRRVDMGDRWSYHAVHNGEAVLGMSRAKLNDLYRDAAMIVNLHGGTIPRPEHTATGRLIYLETDPVVIQAYVAENRAVDIEFLKMHDAFFSFGENYTSPDCGVPQSPLFNFRPTRQPVVLDFWPYDTNDAGVFSTVGNWNQFQDVTVEGETYSWSKRVEFLKFLDLPRSTGQPIELALSQVGAGDRALLEEHGWRVADALEFSYDPVRYRRYIARSRAEFTVAKDQNVRLRSGWFSDRSAAYLASGRPVVTQDTGFGNILPTGSGLFAFSTEEDAVSAIERINADYERHRRAARQLAEDYFDSDVVLGRLLTDLGLPVEPSRRTGSRGR